MTLKQRISDDYIDAFKRQMSQRKSILSVVKGEIQTLEKHPDSKGELTDDDVLKILTKMCKSLQETIDLTADHESIVQLGILREYMPQQMSREEILEKIQSLKNENATLKIGDVMKAFSKDPADKKLVSQLFQEVLS